jgi:hypothetical protein
MYWLNGECSTINHECCGLVKGNCDYPHGDFAYLLESVNKSNKYTLPIAEVVKPLKWRLQVMIGEGPP